jgi:hypothetical protein
VDVDQHEVLLTKLKQGKITQEEYDALAKVYNQAGKLEREANLFNKKSRTQDLFKESGERLSNLTEVVVSRAPHSISVQDIMLLGCPVRLAKVRRGTSASLSVIVQEGSVVLWRLLTKSSDIILRINFRGTRVYGPTKTKGSVWLVRGELQATADGGTLEFFFSNVHSKLVDKEVLFQMKVLEADALGAGNEEAQRNESLYKDERVRKQLSPGRERPWKRATAVVRDGDGIESRMVEVLEPNFCSGCEQPFGVLNRRHHCRSCLLVYCNDCTVGRVELTTEANLSDGADSPRSSAVAQRTSMLTADAPALVVRDRSSFGRKGKAAMQRACSGCCEYHAALKEYNDWMYSAGRWDTVWKKGRVDANQSGRPSANCATSNDAGAGGSSSSSGGGAGDDPPAVQQESAEELAKKERLRWVAKLDALRAAGAGPPDCRAYFRMLDFGVQIEAVLIKMTMDDADGDAIETFSRALGEVKVDNPGGATAFADDLDGEGDEGAGGNKAAVQRRRSLINLRRIHWQGLDASKASKSVFQSGEDRKAADGSKNVSQDEVQLLEKLFLEKAAKKLGGNAAKGKAKKDTGPKVVKLLEVRRSNGVMIALALFKDFKDDEEKLSAITSPAGKQAAAVAKDRAICKAVMEVQDDQLPPSKLQALVEITPTVLELTKLNRFKLRKGEQFGAVEQFFLSLDRRVPRLRDKAESLLFRAQVEEQVQTLEADIVTITMASTEILQSSKLAGLLQTILTVGNILNESSGVQVSGFKLSSLPKLLLTKSPVDRKLTVVDFLVRILWPPPAGQAEHGWAQRERLLLFVKDLPSLPLAWRLPHPRLQLQQLKKSVAALELEANQQQQDEEKKRKIEYAEEQRIAEEEEERKQEQAAEEARQQEEEQCQMNLNDTRSRRREEEARQQEGEQRQMVLHDTKPESRSKEENKEATEAGPRTPEHSAEDDAADATKNEGSVRRVSGLGGLFGGKGDVRAGGGGVGAEEEEEEGGEEEGAGGGKPKVDLAPATEGEVKDVKKKGPSLTGQAALFAAISATKGEEETEGEAEEGKVGGAEERKEGQTEAGNNTDFSEEDEEEADEEEAEVVGTLFIKRKGMLADSWPEVECRYTSSTGTFECKSEGLVAVKVLNAVKIEPRGKHRLLLRENRFDLQIDGREDVVALAASSAEDFEKWYSRMSAGPGPGVEAGQDADVVQDGDNDEDGGGSGATDKSGLLRVSSKAYHQIELACPECKFAASTAEELATHFASAHAPGQLQSAEDPSSSAGGKGKAATPVGRSRFVSATLFQTSATEKRAAEIKPEPGAEAKVDTTKEDDTEGGPPLTGRAALFAAISKRAQVDGADEADEADGADGGGASADAGKPPGHRRRVSLPASPDSGGRAGLLAGITAAGAKRRPSSIADDKGGAGGAGVGGRGGLLAAIAAKKGKPKGGKAGAAPAPPVDGGRGNLMAAIAASARGIAAPGLNRRRRSRARTVSGGAGGGCSRAEYMVGFKPSRLLQQLQQCVQNSNRLLTQLDEQYDTLETSSTDALVYFGEEETAKPSKAQAAAEAEAGAEEESAASNSEDITRSMQQLKLLHEASEIFTKSIVAYDKVWRQQQRDFKKDLPPPVAAPGEPVMTMIGAATMHIQRIQDNVHVVSALGWGFHSLY